MRVYVNNLHETDTFVTDTVKAVLTYDHTFDPTNQYVSDVVGDEITDPSYSRVELTGKVRVVNSLLGTITLSSDDIDFGVLSTDTTNGVILYKEVTNDLDSLLLGYWPFGDVVLDGVSEFELVVPAAGLMVITDASA